MRKTQVSISMTTRIHLRAFACFAVLSMALPALSANVCSNPGKDGPGAPAGAVNSYYPGLSVSAGSTSIPVGAIDTSSGGSASPVTGGDLILVIQMQDADISSVNGSGYGGSSPGSGDIALNNSGVYEYASVAPGYAGGSPILLTAPLKNSYRTSAYAAGSNGQRTFQVIRVPQYSSAALAGTVTAPAWNGATGGVVVFDVAGQLNWNGQTIDVTGRGFRGGAGLYLKGPNATQTSFSVNDYAATQSPANPVISPNPSSANGPFPGAQASKGEGIAGTPRYLFLPTTAGSVTNGSGQVFDTGVEGYPNGSFARGAPGNAGGGGTDGDPAAANPGGNDQNTGGGGGGGYSAGGLGGYGWTPGTPPGSKTGGFGGEGVPLSAARLTMGGGGGAGTTNNGTGTPNFGLASSGAPGGGLVLVRAKTIIGSGTINANGTAGNQTLCNDASGGGGGGGAALVFASGNAGNVGNLTINAVGGTGGSNTGNGNAENSGSCGAFSNNPHGPGGGGGSGFAALSSAANAAINVAGGQGGTTSPSPTSTSPYGSSASAGGFQITSVAATDLPGSAPSSLCYPLLTASKTTSKADTVQGGTTSYTITVSNAAGNGTATGVALSDVLPAPFNVATTDAITLSNGALRSTTTNPAAGATSPAWSAFTIPGGGSVALSFTANVPAATPLATYQNPANVNYDDPTRTAAGQKVTPGGTYQTTDPVAGSNYNPASSTQEDVNVRTAAVITKSFNPVSVSAGGTTVLSIAIQNPNGTALTAAALTDSFPSGLTAIGGAITVTGAGCTGFTPTTLSAGATSLGVSGGTVPANTTCTLSVSAGASSAASFTNTIPAGALTDALNVTNTAPASATLLGRPAIAKSFLPPGVGANTDSTLTFTLTNPNAAQALSGAGFTDAFPANLVATGGAVTFAGTGCTGFAPTTAALNATSFNLTAGTLPAGGTCTVSLAVRSALAGNYANTASGVTTNETVAPGAGSNMATLAVGSIGITTSFSPAQIRSGGTSTVTLSLSNPSNLASQLGVTFTDPLGGMAVSAAQTAGGTCGGVGTNSFTAGQTNLSFTGLSIAAGATCTVSFVVSSSTAGNQTSTTSGVSSTLLPSGPPSNTATLTVTAPPSISKTFSPAVIQTGGASTITFTLSSADTIALTSASFTDALNPSLAVAGSGAVSAGGTCAGASSNSFTAGTPGATLTFSGLTIPVGNSGCTVTIPVTSATVSSAAGYANNASGVSSTEAATGAASAAVSLIVAGAPSITKAFGTSPIAQGGTSTVTFTLSSPSAIALTSAAFTDPLTTLSVAAAGPAGGSCTGASSNSFSAGQIGTLSFSGLTIPASPATCTVTVVLTSTSPGMNPNTASGVTSAQTPVAGSGSNTANLTVASPAQISVGFNAGVILASTASATSNSTLTLTLTNSNSTALTAAAFTDTLSNLQIFATGAAGGTCAGANGNSFTTGSTNLSFSGLTIPAGGSCTVTVQVASPTVSPATGFPNSTSGVTSAQTPTAGSPSSPAYLVVLSFATIAKVFSPAAIAAGGSSTITFTLTNPNALNLSNASFSDNFPTNMTTTAVAQKFIGAGRGTCTGAIPSAQGATATTKVSFVGLSLPANSSCTVTVDVTVSVSATYTNTATGITASETGAAAGPASNGAVLGNGSGIITLSKAFSPATAYASDPTTLTFSLTNNTGSAQSNLVIFSDTFPAGLVVAAPLTSTNSCGGALTNVANTAASVAGDTGIRLQNGSIALGASCAITVKVSASAAGSYPNTTSTITWGSTTGTTGPASNTATLTVLGKATLAKVFNPASVDTFRNSTLTLTLSNPAPSAVTSCGFSDPLAANLSVGGSGTVTAGGTCVGASSNTFAAGSAGAVLSFSGLIIPSSGSCTVTVPITSAVVGSYTNTASGLLCSQFVSAGAGSNTAPVTFNKLPLQFVKSASLVSVAPGTAVTYTLSYTNPNLGQSLQNIVITDTTPKYTSFSAASCGPLPASLTTCTITAPAVGAQGTITWTLGGTLDAGASGSVTLTLTVN